MGTLSLLLRDGLWLAAGLLVAGLPLLGSGGGDFGGSFALPREYWIFVAVVLGASYLSSRLLAGRRGGSSPLADQPELPGLQEQAAQATGAARTERADILVSTGLLMLIASSALLLINLGSGLFTDHAHTLLVALCCFALLRAGVDILLHYWQYLPGLAPSVMVIGNGSQLAQTEQLIAESRGRFRLRKLVDCSGPEYAEAGLDTVTHGEELHEYLRRERITLVIVSFAERRGAFPVDEILQCRMSGIKVVDAVTFYESVNKKLFIESITPSWFIFSSGFRISAFKRLCKRTTDIAGALIGLVLCLPLFPIVALAIKLDSPGPIFFRQVRVGEGDRNFTIFKLRTMRQDAEKGTGAVWASQNDPRITRLGTFLRKTRLDELPQLINVLRGEMSLVGPRPERPEFVRDLKKEIPFYSERHYMKPGLTGWAQVCYPYGASLEDAVEKLRYDLYYIKNYSLFFDIRVICLTMGVVIFRKGAR